MADKKYNPYDNMLSVLKQSAEALGLSYEDYATLCYPERELKVSIPIRMDDGSIKVFEGYRVQHSSARTVQGRHPLPSEFRYGRSKSACSLDVL